MFSKLSIIELSRSLVETLFLAGKAAAAAAATVKESNPLPFLALSLFARVVSELAGDAH